MVVRLWWTGGWLLLLCYGDGMRDNGFKLFQVMFWLGIRKNFYARRVVRNRSRLLREVVESLETLNNVQVLY